MQDGFYLLEIIRKLTRFTSLLHTDIATARVKFTKFGQYVFFCCFDKIVSLES